LVASFNQFFNLLDCLRIKKFPNYNASQKFATRTSNSILKNTHLICNHSLQARTNKQTNLGIDATGLKSASFSQYYENRIAALLLLMLPTTLP
jgi:hypothetical protein